MSERATPHCFSAEQARSLAALLDEIIPPSEDCRLPGAGELGVVSYVETALRQMPVLQPPILQGLNSLEEVRRRRNAGSFAALSKADKSKVLEELQSVDAAFIPTLTFLAFAGYYHDPRIVQALGLEPRPPHPKGYEMPSNDLSLLEPVRRGGKKYRDV